MTDRHGNRVTAISLDGRAVFRATDRYGYLLGRAMGDEQPDPTTPDDLAALGVDLETLR